MHARLFLLLLLLLLARTSHRAQSGLPPAPPPLGPPGTKEDDGDLHGGDVLAAISPTSLSPAPTPFVATAHRAGCCGAEGEEEGESGAVAAVSTVVAPCAPVPLLATAPLLANGLTTSLPAGECTLPGAPARVKARGSGFVVVVFVVVVFVVVVVVGGGGRPAAAALWWWWWWGGSESWRGMPVKWGDSGGEK
ncbi:hypothetical protein B0J12DRAFT_686020 [Macrophomina phaseolina]|uniref:Uncharacterized protein n=1 Tax=Macrophomina phaseolina TaxID=35725 RepID=A0ABQ8FTB9_9PEZI|nr:hypothetical protein B0J12DRAFT_686020 [Macrophomina phaseolina]